MRAKQHLRCLAKLEIFILRQLFVSTLIIVLAGCTSTAIATPSPALPVPVTSPLSSPLAISPVYSTPIATKEKGVVVGALVDIKTGQPISNANVYCSEFRTESATGLSIAFLDTRNDPSTRTLQNGTFALSSPTSRQCMLVATGFARVGELIQITRANGANLDTVNLTIGTVSDAGVAKLKR